MTGVYLGEICLLGLFAINTAPGPIVLMAVFLGFTVIYHIIMRHALKPLMTHLPDSLDDDSQLNMFSTADHKSYDADKAGVPPSEVQSGNPKKFSAKKSSFLGRIFNPGKFKSYQAVKSLVPNNPGLVYSEEEADMAYYNPAITSPVPVIWIARDEMGISAREVRDCSEVLPISDEYARFNEKNKVVWDREQESSLLDVPVWKKRIDY